MLHGGIDCLYKVIEKNNIKPEEIESIEVMGHPTIELPCFKHKEVENVVDAQFNAAYVFSVVANGISIGPEWQDYATMHDPKIRKFMNKIKFQGHPDFVAKAQQDMSVQIYTVDVFARGKKFHEETLHPSGTVGTEGAMSDSALESKFQYNAARILTQIKISSAMKALLNLEKVEKVSELVKEITL
jgi:2-methylcitrate dehydratase PrpD